MAGEITWRFCSMNQSLKARVEALRKKKLISNRLLGKIFGDTTVWSKLRRSCETSGHVHKYLNAF